jgi:16S rRNA (uracil1498-N3)-methyltransferase
LFSPQIAVGSVLLSPEESHHAVAVLRAKVGNEVVVFDGVGGEGLGQVAQADRHAVVVDVDRLAHRPFELPFRITLAVALGRAHRQGYLLEKATELGVAAIWPILAERSVSRPGRQRAGKLSRRCVEAAKQAGRVWVPQLAAPQTLSQAAKRAAEFDAVGVALTRNDAAVPFDRVLEGLSTGARVLVWVGPEGGWSGAERDRLLASGAIPVSLGPNILRTETAAVAVCAIACVAGLGPSHEASG